MSHPLVTLKPKNMKPFERHTSSSISDLLPTCLLALQILDRLDSARVPNPPSLLTIFRLYCSQRLTITQVARQCGCSLGTISNRLQLMHSIIGIHPTRIRNAPRPADSYPLSLHQFEMQNRG
jgi:hypothetical protein